MNLFNYAKYILIFLLFSATNLSAQKVGLVLSGGGAKGMTHIGIIRALEENNIPIDYITGTSMGAIVGSLYAMGYSPDDMVDLIGSEEFRRWYTGQIEQKYMYYFKANPPTPEFFNIRLSLKDTLRGNSVFPNIFPTSIVNPVQMNLAFIELFAPSTAACRRNFDHLFVAFRCIASDVYNKQQLVLGVGDLGDAVRASMSFPGMFKPIKMNDVLVYDGGIYNNFPTDVMREDFNPDIIIGSIVSANPSKPNENDLMSQIENMVMQKTDYSLPDSLGILLNFKYEDVNLMDFDRLQELQDIGYNHTISMMDSIKKRVHRRVSMDNVNLRRMVYKSHLPELIFGNIIIEGANPQQSAYIKKEFREHEQGITFEEFKEVYFRLLADNMIAEIIPHANYNSQEQNYDLHLKVKLRNNFSIRVGGSVSSSSSNQIYFGVTYQDLNLYAKELIFDGQLGKIYNNLQIAARVDFPTTIPISYKFIGSISTFDYYKKENIFSGRDHPAFTKKKEQFVKIKGALPFLSNKKAEFGFGVAGVEDEYTQTHVIDFNNIRYDKSSYFLYGGSITFGGRTLNAKQFPTKGRSEALIAQIYWGKERYYPGEIIEDFAGYKKNHSWLQLSYQNEMYHTLAQKFVLGSYMKLYYSSKNFSHNYTATLLQAGEFTPIAHSKFSYNEAFRANQFLAGGVKPIYLINNLFHLRGEFYGFIPILPIEKNSINNPYYGKAFTRFKYMGQLSAVCQLPFGAISAYVNHYSSPKGNWNFGLTLGWQLFNSRFIE